MRNNYCINTFPKKSVNIWLNFFPTKYKVFCLLKPYNLLHLYSLFSQTFVIVPFATALIFCRKDSMHILIRGREMLAQLSENVLMDQFWEVILDKSVANGQSRLKIRARNIALTHKQPTQNILLRNITYKILMHNTSQISIWGYL